MTRRKLVTCAAALLALIGCSKGGGSGADGRVKVAVVTNNNKPFWTVCEAGAIAAGKEFNAEVFFRKPDRDEVSTQHQNIDAVLQQGVSGVAVSVTNPTEQAEKLRGVAKEVKLVTMDNDSPDSGRVCYIGTDNYAAGRAAGKLVKEAFPEGGQVVICVGKITPLNAQQRFRGVIDELADVKEGADNKGPQYGNYTLYGNEAVTDDANEVTARNRAADIMTKELKDKPICFVGLWAYNAPEILEAARSGGHLKNVKIVGFDEYPACLEGIAKGEIYASVVQDPYMFGYKSVEVLAALARGDQSKIVKEAVPHRIVSKDGVDPVSKKKDRLVASEYKVKIEDLLGQARAK